jgi:HlyD family secretion protein
VTYPVVIDVDNPEQKLFPGMTADVSILVAQRNNALTVPNAALRFTPPAGAKFENSRMTPSATLSRSQRTVYLQVNNTPTLKAVIVKTGITDGVNSEVLEGLHEGERVITASAAGFGAPHD